MAPLGLIAFRGRTQHGQSWYQHLSCIIWFHTSSKRFKRTEHEYGLLGATVYMMWPVEREFMCHWPSRELPWVGM